MPFVRVLPGLSLPKGNPYQGAFHHEPTEMWHRSGRSPDRVALSPRAGRTCNLKDLTSTRHLADARGGARRGVTDPKDPLPPE